MMTGVEVGDRIRMGSERFPRMATVIAVGRCGWGPCPHGDLCVTFRADEASTTENISVERAIPRLTNRES